MYKSSLLALPCKIFSICDLMKVHKGWGVHMDLEMSVMYAGLRSTTPTTGKLCFRASIRYARHKLAMGFCYFFVVWTYKEGLSLTSVMRASPSQIIESSSKTRRTKTTNIIYVLISPWKLLSIETKHFS